MNKSQLIEALAHKSKQHTRLTDRAVNLFFENIKSSLAEGDKVEIRGFGSFYLKRYESYTGHNPKTGEKVKVQCKKLPVFRTGKDLKERVQRSNTVLKNKTKSP